jgi:hypothetical protein
MLKDGLCDLSNYVIRFKNFSSILKTGEEESVGGV